MRLKHKEHKLIHFLKFGHRTVNLEHIVRFFDGMPESNTVEVVTTSGSNFTIRNELADAFRSVFAKANSSAAINVLDVTPAPEPADNSILVETKEGMIRFVP